MHASKLLFGGLPKIFGVVMVRVLSKNKNSGGPYTAAPEIKNHLSYIPSIGAGRRSSFLFTLIVPGSTRSEECGTVTLVLEWILVSFGYVNNPRYDTHREISPRDVFPVISFSHASAHSRTMSVAYLMRGQENRENL